MGSAKRTVLRSALKVFDLALVVGCFLVAAFVVAWPPGISTFEQFLSIRIKVGNFVIFAILLAVWNRVFEASSVYDSKRLDSLGDELANISKATLFATSIIYVMSMVLRVALVTEAFTATFFATYVSVSVAGRTALRAILHGARSRGRNLRYVLIVGTNPRALAFARSIEARPEWGYRIIGFLDRLHESTRREFERSGYQLLGEVVELPQLLRSRPIEEVVIFLPLKSHYHEAMEVARKCEEQGIPVKVSSRLFEMVRTSAVSAEDLDGPLIAISGSRAGWPALAKRAFDVLVSAFLLVLLAPLLAVIAILVKVTSPGPALFVQERLGLGKRRFRMYKFRTMVADAERRQRELESLNEASGPVFKIRSDPRVTPIGAILRKTSLDELPQLVNVLKGDLSLVGPRPLPVRDYEGFDKDWHRRRFSVPPGITCLWQISGRSNVSFDKWMELDAQYIDTWSLWLDVKILLKTIPAVLRRTGAA